MIQLSAENKIVFFKFLIDDISISDIETFIYSTKLEQQIDAEIYIELISFNFKTKTAKTQLTDLLLSDILQEGEFETWKLKNSLNNFINQPDKVDSNLNQIYHLYCGTYQEDGRRKYEYKFLGNLGLNYLYWTDEGYVKSHYGNNWKEEYEKCSTEFEFYHFENTCKKMNESSWNLFEELDLE